MHLARMERGRDRRAVEIVRSLVTVRCSTVKGESTPTITLHFYVNPILTHVILPTFESNPLFFHALGTIYSGQLTF